MLFGRSLLAGAILAAGALALIGISSAPRSAPDVKVAQPREATAPSGKAAGANPQPAAGSDAAVDLRDPEASHEQAQRLMKAVDAILQNAARNRAEGRKLPSDADFTRILNDPAANGVRYLLTVPNEGRGVSDAVNRRYPTVFENGADIATLDLEIPNDGDNQPTWRLYRIG